MTKDITNSQLAKQINGQTKLINKAIAKQISMEATMAALATKNELQKVKNEILDRVDGLAKSYDRLESESAANLGAHDRMQVQINEARRKLGLKTTPVV